VDCVRDVDESKFHHRAAAREAGDGGAPWAGEMHGRIQEGYDGKYDVASGAEFGFQKENRQFPGRQTGRGGPFAKQSGSQSAGGGDG